VFRNRATTTDTGLSIYWYMESYLRGITRVGDTPLSGALPWVIHRIVEWGALARFPQIAGFSPTGM
jgi:hypothetical protein